MNYSSSVPGADIRDWIWSQTGRNAVASFVSGAISALQPVMSDITGIRAGGGMFGELQYPYDGSTVQGLPSYWGYGAAPQHGIDLAPNESPCPLPGYVYGEGDAAQNAKWANWFFRSLASFVQLVHPRTSTSRLDRTRLRAASVVRSTQQLVPDFRRLQARTSTRHGFRYSDGRVRPSRRRLAVGDVGR